MAPGFRSFGSRLADFGALGPLMMEIIMEEVYI